MTSLATSYIAILSKTCVKMNTKGYRYKEYLRLKSVIDFLDDLSYGCKYKRAFNLDIMYWLVLDSLYGSSSIMEVKHISMADLGPQVRIVIWDEELVSLYQSLKSLMYGGYLSTMPRRPLKRYRKSDQYRYFKLKYRNEEDFRSRKEACL